MKPLKFMFNFIIFLIDAELRIPTPQFLNTIGSNFGQIERDAEAFAEWFAN